MTKSRQQWKFLTEVLGAGVLLRVIFCLFMEAHWASPEALWVHAAASLAYFLGSMVHGES